MVSAVAKLAVSFRSALTVNLKLAEVLTGVPFSVQFTKPKPGFGVAARWRSIRPGKLLRH